MKQLDPEAPAIVTQIGRRHARHSTSEGSLSLSLPLSLSFSHFSLSVLLSLLPSRRTRTSRIGAGVHTESSSSRSCVSRCRLKVKCTREPFSRSKALIRSIFPVWKEGLLLIRFSVFIAVISGVCLLVWYGQVKSKKFIETRLLPYVCSVLSQYIDREIDLGKVQRVSPLSITMDTCSIGPHREEFSCGEVPTMKLCLRPFASLRRGKIVIDAILTRPSVLIVQKEDFSWLGIPYSEGTLKRHCSSEEGIDYRTKTRRMAREESIALWLEKRDEDARKAAEMGYIVPEEGSTLFEANALKEVASHSTGLASSDTFFCADERMHWWDHHCVETGVGYDLKHADLEKSFGVKIPETGVKFWSRLIPGPIRCRLKRKAQRREIAVAFAAAKRRILERSAEAAVAYFRGQENAESTDLSQSAGGMDANQLETLLLKSDRPTGTQTSGVVKYDQNGKLDNQNEMFNKKPEKKVDYRTSEPAVDCSTSNKIKQLEMI